MRKGIGKEEEEAEEAGEAVENQGLMDELMDDYSFEEDSSGNDDDQEGDGRAGAFAFQQYFDPEEDEEYNGWRVRPADSEDDDDEDEDYTGV